MSSPAALTILLGDYPHTRPLKDRTVPVTGVDCHFPASAPLYAAFPRMVRHLEFDMCELPLATYLQARDAGVPVTLLPVVLVGNTHHQSLTRLPDGCAASPGELRGQRVGVRSYTQTTGMWVRGILREEYGIEASDITWVTTEEPHVAGYREPAYARRSTARRVADLLSDGGVAAAVLGPRAIVTEGTELVPVIADAGAAAAAWVERHGTVPANHLVVVRNDTLRSSPEAVLAVYRALRAAIAATAGERDETPAGQAVAAGWSQSLARCLAIAGQYAREQELIVTEPDLSAVEQAAAFFDGSQR